MERIEFLTVKLKNKTITIDEYCELLAILNYRRGQK